MIGLLNIHKPYDVTSRDVVNRVQGLVRPDKAGHAGTLDPLATGVLVVCVGAATRLIECVQELPKSYIATFLLGRQSETEDVEAPAVELVNPPVPSREEVEAKLPQFCGKILQRPPAYSALKVQGRRAYALARRGQAVELKPRPITIHQLGIVRYAYPELTLAVECGSGTYVRSLGRDIAAALGTAAVMSALERTAIGKFTVAQACPLEQLTAETLESWLLPPIRAVDHLPSVVLSRAAGGGDDPWSDRPRNRSRRHAVGGGFGRAGPAAGIAARCGPESGSPIAISRRRREWSATADSRRHSPHSRYVRSTARDYPDHAAGDLHRSVSRARLPIGESTRESNFSDCACHAINSRPSHQVSGATAAQEIGGRASREPNDEGT